MALSIAVHGASGSVGATFLTQLMGSSLLRPGDRLLLVGRPSDESRAKRWAIRADLLDAFDKNEVDLCICDDVGSEAIDMLAMAAGATIGGAISTRRELGPLNVSLFQEIASRLALSSPEAVVVIVTNPVELGVAAFCQHFPRAKVVGMGAQQDSLRFARAMASQIGVRRSRLKASALGEHGEAMVPIWSSVFVTDADADLIHALRDLRTRSERLASGLEQNVRTEVGELIKANEVDAAYTRVENVPQQVRAVVEPSITAYRLKSTPNATAHATLAFVAALVTAD